MRQYTKDGGDGFSDVRTDHEPSHKTKQSRSRVLHRQRAGARQKGKKQIKEQILTEN